MSNEDLMFMATLVQAEYYSSIFELISAAIEADENAADHLLYSLGL